MKQIHIPKILKAASVLFFACFLFSLVPAPTHAAFPGMDGEIAYGSFNLDFENSETTQYIRYMDQTGAAMGTIYDAAPISGFPAGFPATPRYSADGSKVVFGAITAADEASQTTTIFVADSDGANIQAVRTYVYDLEDESSPTNCAPQSYSFHPSGTKIIYNEVCSRIVKVATVNIDASDYQVILTGTNLPDACHLFPVYSPNGSKIAYNQIDADGSRIVTANADGSSPVALVEVNQDITNCDRTLLSNVIGVASDGFASPLDWAPDGESLVYVEPRYDSDDDIAYVNIKTVTLSQAVETVAQSAISGIPASLNGLTFISPQFTPEGKLIYLEREASEEHQTVRVVTSERDGSGRRVVASTQSTPDDSLAAFTYITPTVRPLHETPEPPADNQIIFSNAENGAAVLLQTPEDTTLTCSTALKESTQTAQDTAYNYPLGLAEFCFTTEAASSQVTLTFVTNMKSDQVTARKYNSTNGTYFDIANATITQTTYQNQPALQLTYTIEDNGELDLDPATGQIKDPVGLGVREGGLAGTGTDVALVAFIAILTAASGLVALNTRGVLRARTLRW